MSLSSPTGRRRLGVFLGLVASGLLALSSACSSAPQAEPKVAPPPPPPPPAASAPAPASPAKEAPPPSAPSTWVPFPAIHASRLANGLSLRVVPTQGLPLVHLGLVLDAGSATDGSKTGVATVTGELLKEGGAGKLTGQQFLGKLESLGASLSVSTSADATVLDVSVTSNQLEEALGLLASVVREPRLPKDAFERVRKQEEERVQSQARSSGSWAASMALYRALYDQPTGTHPYADFDATTGALAKLTLADCKQWHHAHFAPEAATLVIAGNVTEAAASQAAEKAFGTWKGQAIPRAHIPDPLPRRQREVLVVDRKDSPQSDVYVALWGPERRSSDWPALSVVNQVLGGGVAGRLFLDVREKRSLAYRTGSALREPASGPAPILLVAGTRTERASDAVQALLEHVQWLSTRAPTEQELADAARFLSDSFAMDLERVEGLGALTERLVTRRLDDGYWNEYRQQVRQVTPSDAARIAKQYFDADRALVVVAGDSKVIAEGLRRFGPVRVLDPEQGFIITSKLDALPEDSSSASSPASSAPQSSAPQGSAPAE